MLNIKRKLSQKGFSLIELMVAVAILAMAIFGIFHAYSAGFMGMADARDRTVATNYAREAMEDIKNIDFESISPTSLEQIGTTKFEREISVEDNIEGSLNLKKITTRVFWENRNGNRLNIETTMLVNKIEFLAGDPTRILLYAYPYNVIFPKKNNIELIAVIKDAKGNTVSNWKDNIRFSITNSSPSEYGLDGLVYFKDEDGNKSTTIIINTDNGIARTILYTPDPNIDDILLGPTEVGLVLIEASVPNNAELGTDEVDIRVTWGAISIKLTTPPEITSNNNIIDINTTINIFAQLQNAAGEDVNVEGVEIIFDRIGDGTLIEPSIVPTDSNGTAQITFFSGNNPGTSTITASATNLLSDNITIHIAGAPDYLEVIASPDYIYDDENSTITVTLKDVNGLTVKNPNDEQISINLNVIPDPDGHGTCADNPISIPSGGSSAFSTFAPIGVGQVIIQASDNDKLNGQTTLTTASSLIAKKIIVTTEPSGIKAGGVTPSIITATIKSEDGITTVRNYKQPIIFTIQNGVGSFSYDFPNDITVELSPDDYDNGEAKVSLYANSVIDPGTSNIIVTSTNTEGLIISEEISVIFYVEADYIELTSTHITINAMGKVPSDECEITAFIRDINNNLVEDYVGNVLFTIIDGSNYARFAPNNNITASKPVELGMTTIDLGGYCEPGINYDVKIHATSNFGDKTICNSPDLPITVSIDNERNIEIVDDSINLSSNKKEVEFDITLSGGNLKVYNIMVNNATQKLYDFKINNELLYSGSSDDGTITNIENIEILANNTHHIHIIFNGRIDGKEIQITFNAQPECASVGPIIVQL